MTHPSILPSAADLLDVISQKDAELDRLRKAIYYALDHLPVVSGKNAQAVVNVRTTLRTAIE